MNKYSDFISRKVLREKDTINENLLGHKSNFFNTISKNTASSRDFFVNPQNFKTNTEKFYYRIGSPGISEISVAQNQIISNISLDYLTPQEKILRLPEISSKLTSDKNFSELLEKLDEVITPRQNLNEINLNESESGLFSLETNNYQSFRIKVKGKKCPIFVKFKIYMGKLKIFYSLNDPKPGLTPNSKLANQIFFKITDNYDEFKSEFVYLGIKSLASSSFRIFFHFGKVKYFYRNHKTERIINESPDLLNSFDDYEKDLEQDLKNKNYLKNFVKINIDSQILTPRQKQEEIQNRGEKWKNNREKALLMKKNNLKNKKTKIIQLLNKRVQRLEEETLRQERIERHIELQKFNTNWMKIMLFFKINEFIRRVIKDKRQFILGNITLNQKAIKIQRLYKRKISVKDLKNSESIALHGLKLFHACTFPLFCKTITPKIVSLIKSSANTNFLFDQMSTFFKKIIVIQRAYRKFAVKNDLKLRTLKMQWNRCVDRVIYTKRTNSIRRKESIKLLSIPNVIRDNIIKEYFFVCLKEFKKETRKYLQNKKKEINPKLPPPDFKYLPSEGVMENLIKSYSNYKVKP